MELNETILEGLFASYANGILEEHHLAEKGWTFRFENTTRRIGCCDYANKEIRFSLAYIGSDASVIRNNILHEVAHAIAGKGTGHGPVWKAIARHIGAIPEACNTGKAGKVVSSASYKYTLTCGTCGREYKKARTSKHLHNMICRQCRTPLAVHQNY